jgi:hypothetical protein
MPSLDRFESILNSFRLKERRLKTKDLGIDLFYGKGRDMQDEG